MNTVEPRNTEHSERMNEMAEDVDLGDGWVVSGHFQENYAVPEGDERKLITTIALHKDGEKVSELRLVGIPTTKDGHGITGQDRLYAWDRHWYTKVGKKPGFRWMQKSAENVIDDLYDEIIKDLEEHIPGSSKMVVLGVEAKILTKEWVVTESMKHDAKSGTKTGFIVIDVSRAEVSRAEGEDEQE